MAKRNFHQLWDAAFARLKSQASELGKELSQFESIVESIVNIE